MQGKGSVSWFANIIARRDLCDYMRKDVLQWIEALGWLARHKPW
jgi:hypothetical protein